MNPCKLDANFFDPMQIICKSVSPHPTTCTRLKPLIHKTFVPKSRQVLGPLLYEVRKLKLRLHKKYT